MLKLAIKLLILLSITLAIGNVSAGFLMLNLQKHHGLDIPSDLIFVGHSRTGQSFNVEKIQEKTGLITHKFWVGGADVYDRFAMIKFYLSLYPDRVKYLGYDVDFTLFQKDEAGVSAHKALYPYMDNNEIAAYLKFASGGGSEYYLRKIVKPFRYDINLINASMKGLLNKPEKFYTDTLDIDKFRKYAARTPGTGIDKEKLDCFVETMRYLTRKGVVVLLINTPLPDFMLEKHANDYSDLEAQLADLKRTVPGKIHYLNYSKIYAGDYKLFNDPMHLNKNGMDRFSDLISSDVLARSK